MPDPTPEKCQVEWLINNVIRNIIIMTETELDWVFDEFVRIRHKYNYVALISPARSRSKTFTAEAARSVSLR